MLRKRLLLNKKQCRQQFRDLRRAISSHERHLAAQAAAELLSSQSLFQCSQHIACYLPHPEEFDSLPIIQSIWHAKKHCYLPVVSTRVSTKQLVFLGYQQNDILRSNQYNMLEPEQGVLISPEKLDLVIVPFVAFDLHGYRLGMGAGYYDQTFAFLQGQVKRTPYLLGLGYSVQQAETLPRDAWDVKLDGILTEKQLISL